MMMKTIFLNAVTIYSTLPIVDNHVQFTKNADSKCFTYDFMDEWDCLYCDDHYYLNTCIRYNENGRCIKSCSLSKIISS